MGSVRVSTGPAVDALGQTLHVHHLFDGRAFKKVRNQVVTQIIAPEMKIHVLMNGRQFVGNGFI